MGPVKRQPASLRNALSFTGPMMLLAALLLAGTPARAADAVDEAATNPYLGDPAAIKEGGRLFRKRCTGCHWNPLRGPRIFQTKRPFEKFVEIVINGKKSLRTMPPFGYILSPVDVAKIHAYLMSRERP
jgi:mono/diheme cytochrome c family protein